MVWAGLVEGEASVWEGVSASAEDLAGAEALVEDLAGAGALAEDSAEGGGPRLTPVTTGWLLPTRGMVTPTTTHIAHGVGIRFFRYGPYTQGAEDGDGQRPSGSIGTIPGKYSRKGR